MNSFVQKVKSLKEEIEQLEKQNRTEIAKIEKKLADFGYIASYGSVKLFYDRVQKGDRVLKIDSGIQATAHINGERYATTETTGGGARPTLTRIAVGGLVAGPLGAVIGGAAQKHKKVSSKTIMHDTRSFRLIINSTDGYIQEDNNIFDPQNFIGLILNAIADYSKNKILIVRKKEKLEKSLGEKRKNLLVKKKQAELDALIKNASDEDKKALAKQEKIDTVLRFILILVIIGAIIMLNNNNK